jgi:transposase-like protein
MKGSKHTPTQIIEKLRLAEIELANGATIGQVIVKLGVTEKTYYRWRAQYGGMKAEEARRLKELEVENARLRHLVADLSLDVHVLKEVAKKASSAEHDDAGW